MQANAVVVKTVPAVSTELHNAAGGAVIPNGTHLPLGSSVYDVANLTDPNSTFTGTVTFQFYSGGDCTTGTRWRRRAWSWSERSADLGDAADPAGRRLRVLNAQYIAGSDPNHLARPSACAEPFHIDRNLAVSTTCMTRRMP